MCRLLRYYRYRDSAQVEFRACGSAGESATTRARATDEITPRLWCSRDNAVASRARCVRGGCLAWEVLAHDVRWPIVRAGDMLEVDVTFNSTGEWRGALVGYRNDASGGASGTAEARR